MMENRRIGKFEIEREFIEDGSIVDAFAFLRIAIVRAEMLYHKDAVEYIGISSAFREVPINEIVPSYEIKTESKDGNITYLVNERKAGG